MTATPEAADLVEVESPSKQWRGFARRSRKARGPSGPNDLKAAIPGNAKKATTFLYPLTDHGAAISQIMLLAMDSVMNFSADPDSLNDANDQVNSLILFSA